MDTNNIPPSISHSIPANQELDFTKLHNRILQKISNQKPYSALRHRLILASLSLISFIMMLLATISLTLFFWDISYFFAKTPVSNIKPRELFNDLLEASLFELTLIAGIGVIVIYFLYRQTDLPFVKERRAIFLSIVGSICILSFLGYLAIDFLDQKKVGIQNFESQVQKLPHRKKRNIARPITD